MNRRCTKSGAYLDRWYWGWRHGAYAWPPGYWVARPHYRSHWAPGAWSRPRLALASWSLALMQVVGKNDRLRV